MGFLKTLLILIVIPVFGYIVSAWVLSDINNAIESEGVGYTLSQLCSSEELAQNPDLKSMCSDIAPILLMQKWSIISAVIAALLLVSFIVAASVAGKDRTKVAKIFPPVVFMTLIVLAVLVIIQGAILTYGAYVAESFAIGRVHFILILGVGLGAIIGGFTLISSSFQMIKKQDLPILGKKLDPESHSELFTFIKKISQKLGSMNPKHIVVGLEPNFYVTSADVNVLGDKTKLKGESVYLSLPLLRILTKDEITGIVGHELGHFRGEDTYYSLKFSPVYSSLSHAVTQMGHPDSAASSLSTLPALSVLSYILEVFHTNVSSISREREFEADKAASEVAPAKALASSLLKIGLYAQAWYDLEHKTVERMKANKTTRNLSKLFASVVKYDVNEKTIPEVIESIANQTVSHPTDSHPPTASRIESLGLNISEIEHDLLIMPDQSCIDLLQNPKELEEKLTLLQQNYYMSMGVEPSPKANSNSAGTLISAFAAHMVVADGSVESEEIDTAESIGIAMSKEFDYLEFREFCFYPETIPELAELIKVSSDLEAETKNLIVEYLSKIASSDGEISQEEQQLIQKVSEAFSS